MAKGKGIVQFSGELTRGQRGSGYCLGAGSQKHGQVWLTDVAHATITAIRFHKSLCNGMTFTGTSTAMARQKSIVFKDSDKQNQKDYPSRTDDELTK